MQPSAEPGSVPDASYPPAPWTLRGQIHSSVWWVPAKQLSAPADPEFVPVQVAGRACVMAAFVDYQQGSVLTYHELLAGVIVRHPASGLTGLKVDHIWVDDAQSLRGGRELWGLPKQLARFEFDHQAPGGGFTGKAWDEGGKLLLSGHFTSGLGLPGSGRLPLAATGLMRLRGEVHSVAGGLDIAPRLVRAKVEVPPDSPLATLGLSGRRPLASVSLRDFRIVLPAATPVRRST